MFNIAQTSQYHDSKLPLEIYVELVYRIQQEMVYKPNDFLVRRSGKMYFNIKDVLDYKDAVIDIMADMLNSLLQLKLKHILKKLSKRLKTQHGNNQPAVKE
ncbi:glycerol-3-phosphate dehydrogenase C-terminal domain-containing protein [Staphylococcus aureus]